MAILKCKMCGGTLEINNDATVCECEYCGSKQTIPSVEDEKLVKLFDRANRLRLANEFDKAAGVYESIVAESDTEAEAYWGLLLCKYGIEYVDDPASGDKIPTCHRSSFESIMDDSDFEMVMENADAISRNVYREHAKQIEEIRKGIIEVSVKEVPYDIFICYKETAENGDRTIDSVIAQNIYDMLIAKGYRVFFSRVTLEDKLGQEYEPYIFAALNSAKIMLAFGTDYNYYNAVWVKNEWSRYLKLMAKDKEKYLIPCYKNIDAYDIPKEFKHLQAQDMGKVGADQDLLRGIDKIFGRNGVNFKEKQDTASTVDTNINTFLKRGYMALEDGEWQKADSFFEEVLNNNAECAEAYVGKLMVELKVHKRGNLEKCEQIFSESKNYEKAIRFGNLTLKQELEQYINTINDRNESNNNEKIYLSALSSKNSKDYLTAGGEFKKISGYKDADAQFEECKKLYSEVLKKVKAIAEAIRVNLGSSTIEILKKELEEKTNYICALKKKDAELKNLAENLPELEAEKDRMQLELANINTKIKELQIEQKSLGVFAGKRKKEIIAEIEGQKKIKIRIEEAIKDNASKCQEYTSGTINANISQNLADIEKLNLEISDLKVKLKNEIENPIELISYDEAINLLKEGCIKEEFMRRHFNLYLKLMNLEIGSKITFGRYLDGDIVWRVIDCIGEKYMLISEKALDVRVYNETETNVTWEECSLRKWLNNWFLKVAFNREERELIEITTVEAHRNPKHGISAGNDTKDKLFILSGFEANKYFKDNNDRICKNATKFTKVNRLEFPDACPWMLRTPGKNKANRALVRTDGVINYNGMEVDYEGFVRPAMWINLG